MTRCPEREKVQLLLDGDLSAAEAHAFRVHLEGCDACGAEARAYSFLFGTLGALRVQDPGPVFTERILDRVLPSRLRRRIVTAVGWAYTAVSAISTYLFVSWIARAETHVWLAGRLGQAYLSVVQAGLFVVHSLMFSWLRLLDGWEVAGAMMERLAPLVRALALPLSQPAIASVLVSATLACAAVFWWMGPRRGAPGEVRHVALLGF